MKRILTVLSTLAGSLTLLLSLGVMPASANTAHGYVGGTGSFTDDWGDEGTLSQSSHSFSRATGLWQTVLYADGARKGNGNLFTKDDIDCQFGSNTAAATRDWQGTHHVKIDGIVGPQTFGAADGHLHLYVDESDDGIDDMILRYVGSAHSVFLTRLDGEYWFTAPSSGLAQVEVPATYGTPPDWTNGNCW